MGANSEPNYKAKVIKGYGKKYHKKNQYGESRVQEYFQIKRMIRTGLLSSQCFKET